MRTHALLFLALVGCGGEDTATAPSSPGGGGGGGGKPAKAKAAAGKPLAPKLKVEDRVVDPAEKASIRHKFSDKDFAVEQANRDPFQSFVLGQKGLVPTDGGNALPRDITKKCVRADQFVASNYSYTDLRLVGIVAERAQRKVLMMDAGNLGHIIKKGDCVGREKARVKDIGTGFITFQVDPEEGGPNQARQVEEHSVQLYPNQMPVQSQPTPDVPTTQAPVVAPPAANTQPVVPSAPIETP